MGKWLQTMSQAEGSLSQLTSLLSAKEAELAESQNLVQELRAATAAEASSASGLQSELRGQISAAQEHAEQLQAKLQGKRQVRGGQAAQTPAEAGHLHVQSQESRPFAADPASMQG